MTSNFKRISLLLVLSLSLAFLTACKTEVAKSEPQNTAAEVASTEVSLTKQQVNEDFDAFMKIIEENYPFLEINKRLNGVDFLAQKEVYRSRLADVEAADSLYRNLSSIMKELNSGHANLLKKEPENRRDYGYKIYKNIAEGDEYPSNEIYRTWLNVFENPSTFKFYGPLPEVENGESDKAEPQDIQENNVVTNEICDKNLAYIAIDSFNYFNEDYDRETIMKFLKKNKDAKVLVIDIRKNSGGSTDYWKNLLVEPLLKEKKSVISYSLFKNGENNRPFIEAIKKDTRVAEFGKVSDLDKSKFSKAQPEVFRDYELYIKYEDTYEPNNTIGFKGKIYVLTSPWVYSASEGFTIFCKETGFAKLVGTITGGDGLGSDPFVFSLPNSGIIGRYTGENGITNNGESNEEVKTIPDYPVNNTIDPNDLPVELLNDPCILEVIKLEGLKI